MMAGMDKLFSACGFDFLDTEELIAELPTSRTLWDAPAFDQVLYYADPSGIAVTAMSRLALRRDRRKLSDVAPRRRMPFLGVSSLDFGPLFGAAFFLSRPR